MSQVARQGQRYPGNQLHGVGKAARYSVTADGHIRLVYMLDRAERALLTTKEHAPLVDLVDKVKLDNFGVKGGAFFINEFRHVLVPDGGGNAYFAGTYHEDLEFEFEGTTIRPSAPDGLQPGEVWRGPHVGIRYVIAAGGRDVYYEFESRPNVMRRVRLSDEIGGQQASHLLRDITSQKPAGGRLYVNEAREFFAPMNRDGHWEYIYLGNLEDRPWFPAPSVEDGTPR